MIANEQGSRTTPALVGFNDEEILLAEPAQSQRYKNVRNTIYDIKHMLGKKLSDKDLQYRIKSWPFKVDKDDEDEKDVPRVNVVYKEEKKTYGAVELASMMLEKMRVTAEEYTSADCTKAVITCPASFNDEQRGALAQACKVAGLNVMRFINEPAAAALAYRLDQVNGEQTVLVFDLGAATCDASVLSISNGVFTIKASASDAYLGGQNFDEALMKHFAREFNRKTRLDCLESAKAKEKLREACERARVVLSKSNQTNLEIDSLYEGCDLFTKITKARFESECTTLFNRCMNPIYQALQKAQLKQEQVDKVILSGGGCHMPKLQALIKQFFGASTEILNKITPDEAVTMGATIQASLLVEEQDRLVELNEGVKDMTVDVTTANLGIESAGELMVVVVPASTSLPADKSTVLSTYYDDQSEVMVNVYEGNHYLTTENKLLGRFSVSGIPPAPRGCSRVKVAFHVAKDSSLSVTATVQSVNSEGQVAGEETTLTVNAASVEADKASVAAAPAIAKTTQQYTSSVAYVEQARRVLFSYVSCIKHVLSTSVASMSGDEEKLLSDAAENAAAFLKSMDASPPTSLVGDGVDVTKLTQHLMQVYQGVTGKTNELDQKVGAVMKKLLPTGKVKQ